MDIAVVRLIHERTLGILKQQGAYVSLIQFSQDGHEWTVMMPNDEFEIVDYIVPEEIHEV